MALTDVYCRVNRARGMEVCFVFSTLNIFGEMFLVFIL